MEHGIGALLCLPLLFFIEEDDIFYVNSNLISLLLLRSSVYIPIEWRD